MKYSHNEKKYVYNENKFRSAEEAYKEILGQINTLLESGKINTTLVKNLVKT